MPERTPRAKDAPSPQRRDEPYMDERQTEHFRQLLLAWKHQLRGEVERTVQHLQEEAVAFADPNDRASQEERAVGAPHPHLPLELRARDRERRLIHKIDLALGQLDEGTYGYCEACGEPIGARRLEARPTATLCIDCKEIEESRDRQRA